MYAHQVIEDLKKYHRYNSKDDFGLIESSVHFFLGDLENLMTVFYDEMEKIGSKTFVDGRKGINIKAWEYLSKNLLYSKMPFDRMTIQYYSHSWKILVVCCAFNIDFVNKDKSIKENAPAIFGIPFYKFNSLPWYHGGHTFLMDCSNDGGGVDIVFNEKLFTEKYKGHASNDFIENDYQCAQASCITLIQFMKMLNCKNVSTEKNYPSEALNKKRIKQGKQPLFTYHTLVVNTMSDKKRSDGPHKSTGIKQRLHFCRGHFKEYTESNKLFGKHTGLYWWQPMVRGNKELGLVHKDYEVRASVNA